MKISKQFCLLLAATLLSGCNFPGTSKEKEKVFYNIEFKTEDGSESLYSTSVEEGTVPTYVGETPEKVDDLKVFKFEGWKDGETVYKAELPAASKDTTYLASFEVEHEAVVITWVVNGESNEESYKYDSEISYKGETAKSSDAQYTYTFDGWALSENGEKLSSLPRATENVTYYAVYKLTTNTYTVTFVDDEENQLQSSAVAYGSVPTYNATLPSKDPTAQYTYTFKGWTDIATSTLYEGDLPSVTQAVTYKATYTSTTNKYLVKFLNEDLTELYSHEFEYGTAPTYSGSEPEKVGDAQYSYYFIGWKVQGETTVYEEDDTLPTVVEAVTFVAVFEQITNKYTVTFYNEDGVEILQSTKVAYGTKAEFKGTLPTKTATKEYTYEFDCWVSGTTEYKNDALPEVTGAISFTAKFKGTKNKYTIRFLAENGSVLQSSDVEYGVVPTFNGETPTKQGNEAITYTFAGWKNGQTVYEGALPQVTGAADYVATFSQAAKKYKMTISMVAVNNAFTTETDEKEYEYSADELVSFAIPEKAGYVANREVIKDFFTKDSSLTVYYSTLAAYNATASTSLDGAGTEESPYLIKSSSDFAYIDAQVLAGTTYKDNFFKLTNSIDMGGNELGLGLLQGETKLSFAGFIDGNHCIIKNLGGSQGVVAYATTGLGFKDLSISGTITSTTTYAAGFVGYGPVAGACSTIDNCYSYATIKTNLASGSIYAASFVGYGGVKMNNCEAYGLREDIGKRKIYGAGLVSYANTNSQIKNSTNFGDVKSGSGAGGAISSASKDVLIENVNNFGNVTCNYTTVNCFTGGVLAIPAKDSVVTMKNCKNYGDVVADNMTTATGTAQAAAGAGGIIGGLFNGTCTVTVDNCVNNGDITSDTQAAGIVGTTNAGVQPLTITNCVNNGTITVKTQVAAIGYGGGIVSWVRANALTLTSITDCVNNGAVIASTKGGIGGIVGCTGGTTNLEILRCTNNGAVTGATNSIGGIFGFTTSATDTKLKIADCTNTGAITGSSKVAGIIAAIACASFNTISITNCTNTGVITASSQKGDIIGSNASSYVYGE